MHWVHRKWKRKPKFSFGQCKNSTNQTKKKLKKAFTQTMIGILSDCLFYTKNYIHLNDRQ